MQSTVLVTGGAGYIGSHVVKQLLRRGEQVVVLDNLSTGFAEAVGAAELVVGDMGDYQLVSRIMQEHQVEAVMHFAAHTIVSESVARPLKYYANNTCGAHALLLACNDNDVEQFIFSSTAAVYGIPPDGIATEQTPTAPINPYGSSKLMVEWMLKDLGAASPLDYVVLRYFNVAGSDPEGAIGQSTPHATLLIKVACEAAVGKRDKVTVFGTDYATPDGTCIRDYIHVEDLADVHLRALDYLREGGDSMTMNCGYGHGYSVREVLQTVNEVVGQPLNIVEGARRPGDPPELVADVRQLRELFGWQPRYDDLRVIVETALAWEKRLLERPMQ